MKETVVIRKKVVILRAFGSADNFGLAEVDTHVVKDNNVLVKIKASAFNPVDYQMRTGSLESKLITSPILGRELSGVIVQTGVKVKGYFVG